MISIHPAVMTDLKIAVVCSSNQNRSMEAHNFLRYELSTLNKQIVFFSNGFSEGHISVKTQEIFLSKDCYFLKIFIFGFGNVPDVLLEKKNLG